MGLLLAGLVAVVARTRWQVVDGVVEVCLSAHRHPQRNALAAWPFAAITLGHVVVGISAADLARLRVHEHAHVRQYEGWGVFFLLAYPAAGAWQLLRGRRAHRDNPFEIEARNEELRVNGP
jgi:hypothetical protein